MERGEIRMAKKKSSKGTISDTLVGRTAKAEITDNAREFLKANITLPLGNPDLKKVHTNQFIWVELPEIFPIEYWETIAQVFQSEYTRYTGYEPNRWYIEGCDITVEAQGKAEMKLDLNAFATSRSKYTKDYRGFQDAYNNAFNKNKQTNANNSTKAKNTSSGKNKTNAVGTPKVLYQKWVNHFKIPKVVTDKVQQICKAQWSQYQKAHAVYEWMDAHIDYAGYSEHQRSLETVLSMGSGNCVDNSRLYRAFMLSMGIKCSFVQNTCTDPNHQYNKVYCDGKGYIVDCGREMASWGSNWGGNSSCGVETNSSW